MLPPPISCSIVYFDVVISVNVTRGSGSRADVVVVGSGAAALAAALAAHDAGARVAVVERASAVGGTTAVSGGGVWMPRNYVTGAEIGRAHVRTPVPNAPIVCRLLLE